MTSYAYTNRAALPGTALTLDSAQVFGSAFNDQQTKKEPSRASSMVAKDQPQPLPRPSPDMADEADRVAFDQRWSDETRAARKAAFMDKRKHGHDQTRTKTFNRNVTRTR